MYTKFLLAAAGIFCLTGDQPHVDLSKYDSGSGIEIVASKRSLTARWKAKSDRYHLKLSLSSSPLFEEIGAHYHRIAEQIDPRFVVTVGTRKAGEERYVFFDKPAARSFEEFPASLILKDVFVESQGRRATIRLSSLVAGPFAGELQIHIYAGSPLIHLEAVLTPHRTGLAYIYDALLLGNFRTAVWQSLKDRLERTSFSTPPGPVQVRYRTIMAETGCGTVAVFPPPHAFFFPRDRTDNFGFAQVTSNGFGLHQDPSGGGAFVPWFDAPAGNTQRMGMFILVQEGDVQSTLNEVKRYTHNDRFESMPGRITFTSHWHSRITVNEMKGKPNGPELREVFKSMNVNVVHLAEFHGDGNFRDPGPKRLPELRAMFEACRKYSDSKLLLVPGEEGTGILANPGPNEHGGHWMYLFPKPVYFTFHRSEGTPFVEYLPPYGSIYHVGSREDMVALLRTEGGIVWTSHPRIKASYRTPDAIRDQDFYKGDLWLGAAWKSMPADLSQPRLGVRALDVLDDMNQWGQKKFMPAEVDVFEIDGNHELYGHMNVNYLRLPRIPAFEDWSQILVTLKRGDFFSTTGEVLIHSFNANTSGVEAKLEWTFPLSFAELVWWDGKTIRHRTIALNDTQEFRRNTFRWAIDLNHVRWIRLEVWDVASNGAFTQPLWLR